ncbi:hypothetical protein PSTEL_18620 [Paenibacillus stellifer]|uniref:Methyltransferase type 11 domain-containing protein n=1 Tax=Paenibacillus stellifer TaxID=169760 RepID=A0A089LV96_9BACL|nr:class I SAM-dependent methyltransferase [Paenibacillus stellifer]AIQ64827.1 hypothetical protein PSTEL_18620 [Paenibacillus stellifer]
MPINFHDRDNQHSYASRDADNGWIQALAPYITFWDKTILDIGCGGGIYTKAMAAAGARRVTGLDSSAEMLKGAAQNCEGLRNVEFVWGDAVNTGMARESYDIVLERAVIHHLQNPVDSFREVERVLKPGGYLIVQDRTPDDCLQPRSQEHIRGYFFEKFPRLLELDIRRRPSGAMVRDAINNSGLALVKEFTLWEIRRTYREFQELSRDLLGRTGRSLLHELNDDELLELVAYIGKKLPERDPVVEQDRWTLWIARKLGRGERG